MIKRIECIISGRVQLVMYRDFATRTAKRCGIVGTVHNESNGTVTLIAEGEENVLKEYIVQLQKGSILSWVNDVAVEWLQPSDEFSHFDIRY